MFDYKTWIQKVFWVDESVQRASVAGRQQLCSLVAADDQTGNLTETNSVSSCLYSLQYKMFQHVTNEPEAALSAPAVLLAELHLHTDATQPHSHICRCLLAACQQVGHKHKECRGFSFFI